MNKEAQTKPERPLISRPAGKEETDIVAERYDIVFLFDATKCNPNGDPDAGNMPRVQPDTLKGLVTDVCLKRKIRNFFGQYKPDDPNPTCYAEGEPPTAGYALFVHEGAVFERIMNSDAIKEKAKQIFVALRTNGSDKAEAIQKAETEWNLEKSKTKAKKGKGAKKSDEQQASDAGSTNSDEESKGSKDRHAELKLRCYSDAICQSYFDVRAFGAVLSTKGPLQGSFYGQVRGPLQMTFAESLDKIHQIDTSITRCAVASEDEADKERMFGRKHWADYGLYRCHVHFSPAFAAKTRFTYGDLDNFLFALKHCLGDYNVDIAAARAGGSDRGGMCVRGIIVFRHTSALGNAPAHKLFDLVKVSAAKEEREESGRKRLVFVRENDEFSPFPQGINDYYHDSNLPKDGQAMKYNSAEGKVEFGENKQKRNDGPASSSDFPITVHRLVWEIPEKSVSA